MVRARAIAGAAFLLLAPGSVAGAEWPSAGGDLANTRHQPAETAISPATAGRLGVKWQAALGGHISATPAVDATSVYIVDAGGWLTRLDRETGAIVWQTTVSSYTGVFGDLSRTTPALTDSHLIFGTQSGPHLIKTGARIIAVDKAAGDLAWQTTIEDQPQAVITQSPVIHDGRVFVGTSSWEEYVAAKVPGHDCCNFRGSLAALDATTGEIVWQTRMVPDAPGYSGNPVFGSTPAVDPARGTVYVTTGNNYSVPEDLRDCVAAARRARSRAAEQACIDNEPDNYVDAFVALDRATGAVKWYHSGLPYDPYTQSCFEPEPNPQNCPAPKGPDYDFAQGPILFTIAHEGNTRAAIGAGQKSGVFWTLDRDTGTVIWQTHVGPGSALGGMEWGSASDGARLYVAVANFAKQPWTLRGTGSDARRTIRHGFWSALDAATGEILWQTADPNTGAPDMGAVTVANGVVFAGSMANGPDADTMFALDAASGAILWRFASGGSVSSGAAVLDGVVYWGTGYGLWGGRRSNKLYAFEVK